MENLAILYFSSTGNSLYIAQQVNAKLGGDTFYIPTFSGDGGEYEKIIIVTPIYSFGMPSPVLELLQRLNNQSKISVIQNYGGYAGGADRLIYEYALKYGLNVNSIHTIKMPENYTLVMSPPRFYTNAILKTADKRISRIVDDISQEKTHLPRKKVTNEKTYLKNKSNWHLISGRFSVDNDKCVKCLKCTNLCPAHNISLQDGQIRFGDKCIACLGCFHRCSQNAIVYNGKNNKKRYINPNVDETKIGKDEI